MRSTNLALVNTEPSTNLTNGPGIEPLFEIALTGHNSSPVVPNHIATPRACWSVSDHFRNTRTLDGGSSAFVITSPHAKCTAESNVCSDGVVISPALENPKKHMTAAAHSVFPSMPPSVRIAACICCGSDWLATLLIFT